ncbi:MAG: prepilin peptidase [Methylocapsa sp.]|nr:prepilin peptidase [Methylocapsa sp.]
MLRAVFAALACATVAASLFAAPGREGFFGAVLGLLMLAIAAADARSFIIPDRLSLAALALGLAHAASGTFADPWADAMAAAGRAILLATLFLLLRAAYYRLRRRHGIGLGDIKLAAVAGAWLDFALLTAAVEIAALSALGSYAISRLFLGRPFEAAVKMPFGLFFAPAIWLCWLAGAILFAG